jgi:hypothetical protein
MFVLVLPGVLSALGFYWLVSSQFPLAQGDVVAPFMLVVPWQALGLTLCKMGIDTWAMARTSIDKTFSVALANVTFSRVVPISVAFGLALAFVYPPLVAALVAASCAFDAVALVIAGEFAGRGKYVLVTCAHLMRWPAFFLIVAVDEFVNLSGLTHLLLVTVLLAAARLVFLLIGRSRDVASSARTPPGAALMGVQQVMNFGLFKNDQLAFSLAAGRNSVHAGAESAFVYLARFPELVSAFVTAVFPRILNSPIVMRSESPGQWSAHRLRVIALATATSIVGASLLAGAYVVLSPRGMRISTTYVAAIAFHAALILPANIITLRYLRRDRVVDLNRILFLANVVGCGAALGIYLFVGTQTSQLLWVVPIQLVAFIGAGALCGVKC